MKLTWLNNHRYNIPEDVSFMVNELDEKDAEIQRLRNALKEAADALEDWGAYVKANKAREALEGGDDTSR